MVVSVHDVAPVTRSGVDKILEGLARHGVATCSLLVVPNYQRRGHSLGNADFCAWLHEMEALGHEIVIHGFFHERARRENETVREKLVTRFYTAGEGEFFDLRYITALNLIRAAQHDFAAHGFRPSGFIAPAWLLGGEAERAAIDAGMTYTTTLRTVRDFVAGHEFASRSLVYSVRNGWRRAVSLVWNRLLFARLTTNELLRLSIHPPDITHAAIWRQILTMVDRGMRDRKRMTYQNWLLHKSEVRSPKSEMV
jgi:predicted deacetylase